MILEAAAPFCESAVRLRAERNYPAARTAIKRALALDPNSPELIGEYGAVLWNTGEFEEAAVQLKKATDLEPDNPTYWAHLALALSSMDRNDEAESVYQKAFALSPKGDNLGLTWNYSQFLLSTGQWEKGFEAYESRIAYRGAPLYQKLSMPSWKGEDLTGKRLLIIGEQGVGDMILASRFFRTIKERWPTAKILCFIQPRLHDLFWEFRHEVELWPAGHPWPEADYAAFVMSLPGALNIKPNAIPPDPGLILKRAEASKGSIRLKPYNGAKLRVGIVWTGNPDMMANAERSIPIECFEGLAANPDISLYSLQVGDASYQREFLGDESVIKDCSPDLKIHGYAGTASLMLNLDLVITVCTSAAHLAGALGVPCWTLLCHDPYWMWGRKGDTTDWYPNMRLFRQDKAGDWAGVMRRVEAELQELVSEKPALAA